MRSGTVSKFEPRRRARRRALQALYQWRLNPRPPREIVRQFLDVQDFSEVDSAWFKEQVLGVAGSWQDLESRVSVLIDREAQHLDVIERIILLQAAWEIDRHPELPPPVVIDEAVELTKRFGAEQAHGYVNAVLDKAVKSWLEPTQHAPGLGEGTEGER